MYAVARINTDDYMDLANLTDPSKQEDYDNYKAAIEESINFIMKEWDLK